MSVSSFSNYPNPGSRPFPMRILHLNAFDVAGGAARAASRLHQGLLGRGIDSRMLVQTKTSHDPTVEERYFEFTRQRIQMRYWAEVLPLLPYRGRPSTHWATEWCPTRISSQIDLLDPDVIHMHWVCRGFMSLADIGRLRKPAVWTLHDSWPFTGGCHVPGECTRYREQCGRCPQLASKHDLDLSRWTWRRKSKLWRNTNITVVTPSQWLADCARRSSLLGQRRIDVIPNGIDLALYFPESRQEARAAMGLPQDRKLILFSAMNATLDVNKGFRFIEAALQQLAATGWQGKVELLVAGQTAPVTPVKTGIPTRFLGVLKDEASMRQAFSAADITVMTSIQENLPNSIMESMACGTPVAAFAIGGIPELIQSGLTGHLAQPFDTADLTAGLASMLTDTTRCQQMGRESRLKVEREFDAKLITKRYVDLYEQLLHP